MTSEVTYLTQLRTNAVHLKSGNTVITDAPTDNQGKGEAFSPTDLVATALASCMLTIMGIAAEKRGMDIDDTHAEVTKIMASNPRRIQEVKIKITMPNGDFTEAEMAFLEKVARNCPVAKSLHEDLVQTIDFEW